MAALYQAAKVREGKIMGIHAINRQHPMSWQPYTMGSKGERRKGNGNPYYKQTAPTSWPPFIMWQRMTEGKRIC
jgi:hypothetical protein